MLVQCTRNTVDFHSREIVYANAIDTKDGVQYSVQPVGKDLPPVIFSEDSFKKHFVPVQHRSSSGRRSYGGFQTATDNAFKTESDPKDVKQHVQKLLDTPPKVKTKDELERDREHQDWLDQHHERLSRGAYRPDGGTHRRGSARSGDAHWDGNKYAL